MGKKLDKLARRIASLEKAIAGLIPGKAKTSARPKKKKKKKKAAAKPAKSAGKPRKPAVAPTIGNL